MPSLGPMEIVVIFLVALVVFGPDKLPQLAKQTGRGIRELRRLQAHLRSELDDALGPDFLGLHDADDDEPEDYDSTNRSRGADTHTAATTAPAQPAPRDGRLPAGPYERPARPPGPLPAGPYRGVRDGEA